MEPIKLGEYQGRNMLAYVQEMYSKKGCFQAAIRWELISNPSLNFGDKLPFTSSELPTKFYQDAASPEIVIKYINENRNFLIEQCQQDIDDYIKG